MAKSAPGIFMDCMSKYGGVEPTFLHSLDVRMKKKRVKMILEWFKGMANAEELKTLADKDADEGERTEIVNRLNDLIVRRLREAFEPHVASAEIAQVPPSVARGRKLSSSTLGNVLEKLGKCSVDDEAATVKCQPTQSAEWRRRPTAASDAQLGSSATPTVGETDDTDMGQAGKRARTSPGSSIGSWLNRQLGRSSGGASSSGASDTPPHVDPNDFFARQ